MNFPKSYNSLDKQSFEEGDYSIEPIRFEDRMLIRKWRNEQVFHLRQNGVLTVEGQELYFKNVVSKLFIEQQPNQLLFSYLKNGECIGYGGLVHINWIDKNAEISFLMNSKLEKLSFVYHWRKYLSLIEELAFNELKFHKIYTYAFDLRPKLYDALSASKFEEDARLKEHCFFENKYIDVLIHSKYNLYLEYREFTESDKMFIYILNNEQGSRSNSFNPGSISIEEHENWFKSRLNDLNSTIYVCESKGESIGIVRFQKEGKTSTIGVNLIKKFRSKGLAKQMLLKTCSLYLSENQVEIIAYIKKENLASIKTFENAGFTFKNSSVINEMEALVYKRSNND